MKPKAFVMGVERSGTAFTNRTLVMNLNDRVEFVTPEEYRYKHVVPAAESEVKVVVPTRSPYMWLDSYQRWRDAVGKSSTMKLNSREVIFAYSRWVAGNEAYLRDLNTLTIQWEKLVWDFEECMRIICDFLGVDVPRKLKKTDKHIESAGTKPFDVSYYSEGKFLKRYSPRTLQYAERHVRKWCKDTVWRLGYSTNPGENCKLLKGEGGG